MVNRRISLSLWLLLPALILSGTASRAAEKAAYDSMGRVIALISPGEDLPLLSNLVAVLPSGRRVPLQTRKQSPGATRAGNGLVWSAPFTLPDGGRGRMELRSTEDAASIHYSVSVAAETNLEVDSIEFVVDIPRERFVNGQFTADSALPAVIEPVRLGPVKPHDSAFFRGTANALHLHDAAGQRTLDLAFEQPTELALLDNWDASGRSYQVRIPIKHGSWYSGMKSVLAATLRLTDETTTAPLAHVNVDASQPRYKFQGFGGNYCWDNRSPVAAYTLDHLKIAWARTAMKPVEWDKQRDVSKNNLSPELRADLEVMQRLQKMGVPYVISVWSLPERFYTDPNEKPPSASGRTIDPEKWDELLKLLGDYLLFAKREYNVEPDFFSFNETNIGINIGLTPEAHAKAIERIGAYFQKIGLKTKMLLGDTAGPRDTHTYALEAASDPAAVDYLGAVAFHSWGGGNHDHYSAWGDLAEWLHLPLLVTEVGVDPFAYRTRSWDSYDYGLREARMIQELLTSARPQGLLFWQYTDDYGLARVGADGVVEPSARFWIMKQFSDLTPPHSGALAASSDQSSVLVTAFRSGVDTKLDDTTLHVLNLGAARSIEIKGIPDGEWRVVETTEDAHYRQMPALQSSEHGATVTIPARSLVTLSFVTHTTNAR